MTKALGTDTSIGESRFFFQFTRNKGTQTAKIPPNESFSLLPTAVQNELWKKVEYSSYEDFKAICDQYPNTTQKLQNWLKLVQDPKSYLTAVYERARQQFVMFISLFICFAGQKISTLVEQSTKRQKTSLCRFTKRKRRKTIKHNRQAIA